MATIEELLKSKPIADPLLRAMIGVMYTGNWFQNRMNALMKPFGITEPQFNVLRILRGQQGKPISVNSIQERMVQRSSNVSRIIDKLVEKELASRTICRSNKRQVDVCVTGAGLKLLTDIEPALNENNDVLRKLITTEDAECVSRFLDALRNAD